MKLLFTSIAILLSFIIDAQDIYFDQILDKNIRTVQMQNIVPIGSSPVLEFDYIHGDGPYMIAKIVHCDWNWKKSIIFENEFMSVFNEFQLNDVEASSSAYIPYFHYRFILPKVKMSGNYVLLVYDEDNPKKKYLQRRFSVYEDRIVISGSSILSNVVRNRFTHQQIDFQFGYNNYEIQDPYQNLHAVVRQNQRWDNAKMNLKPSYINEANKVLKFNYFGGESSYSGGIEYRQVFFGRQQFNVDHFEKTNEGTHYFLREDINRANMNYSDTPDNNGYFDIDSPYDADYSHVHFILKSDKQPNDVYVFGQLSDWNLQSYCKMDYDSTSNKYEKTILLKNGEYDFAYALDNINKVDEVTLQGSHSETRNEYEILIYYRPFGKVYDKLIGYKRIN